MFFSYDFINVSLRFKNTQGLAETFDLKTNLKAISKIRIKRT